MWRQSLSFTGMAPVWSVVQDSLVTVASLPSILNGYLCVAKGGQELHAFPKSLLCTALGESHQRDTSAWDLQDGVKGEEFYPDSSCRQDKGTCDILSSSRSWDPYTYPVVSWSLRQGFQRFFEVCRGQGESKLCARAYVSLGTWKWTWERHSSQKAQGWHLDKQINKSKWIITWCVPLMRFKPDAMEQGMPCRWGQVSKWWRHLSQGEAGRRVRYLSEIPPRQAYAIQIPH